MGEWNDRYEATGRLHTGCDECDGMGVSPVPADVKDPLWQAAHARAPSRVPGIWARRWRVVQSIWKGRAWLWFSKRMDARDTRFARCPYCRPAEVEG